MAARRLLVGSFNPGKVAEVREALAAAGIDIPVMAMKEVQGAPIYVERGTTFEQNAIGKAIYYSRFGRDLVLCDDSGLCVDALDGAPGIASARFGMEERSATAGPGREARSATAGPGREARSAGEARREPAVSAAAGSAADFSAVEDAGAGDRAGASGGEALADTARWKRLLEMMEQVPDGQRGAKFVCVMTLGRWGRLVKVFHGECRGTILRQPRGSGGFGYDPVFHHPASGRTFAEMTSAEKRAVSHRGAALRQVIEFLKGPDSPLTGKTITLPPS